MNALLLSGVGGSTNWLPLISPLVAILVIAYSVDFVIKYVKKRKALREEARARDLAGHFGDVSENTNLDL